ncbi:quinol oxidase subunit I [Staphylococcus aureus]|nr:quinol oxidase subunit I [Staphylococcus aureus]
MIWRSFQQDYGYHIHAEELAENEEKLRKLREEDLEVKEDNKDE